MRSALLSVAICLLKKAQIVAPKSAALFLILVPLIHAAEGAPQSDMQEQVHDSLCMHLTYVRVCVYVCVYIYITYACVYVYVYDMQEQVQDSLC
jgi:hypothetical protein